MKEFWIFKEDGSSYIEDGQDINNIYIPKNSTIEEHTKVQSINNTRFLTEEEDEYYENLFNKINEERKISNKYINVDIILENQKILSEWEKRFVFGVKRQLKNNANLSKKQEQILNNIYVEKYNNIA